ncbi:MAG TPA: 30S ribosomal protein S8 [Candidatus Vogelbacteria bacterium]|nr:30S ribosomal protein S8 [Candidatus Vogelbacteria bacterium]
MFSDPIADMLIRIKNASRAGRSELSLPYSKIKASIAKVLLKNGFLRDVGRKGKKTTKQIVLILNEVGQGNIVSNVKRISKPSKRVYYRLIELKKISVDDKLRVLSTPHGILSAPDAIRQKTGGELLFEIW